MFRSNLEEWKLEMFDAVIFDWDGTLADTKWAVVNSFQKVLKEIGCKVSDRFIERKIGMGAKETFKDALKTAKMPFNDEMISKLVEKKVEAQLKLTKEVKLFEGTIELLNSLQNKVRMALASMNNGAVITKLLTQKGVMKYFDVVITVEEVLYPKPNPEIFLKCARRLRCHPERCVVLEDSVFGIQAAKNANMKCIAILTGAYSEKELTKQKPDLIFTSIAEKERILGFIFG
jgi:HAD superfamily hydrolase (TIGR01509 family)